MNDPIHRRTLLRHGLTAGGLAACSPFLLGAGGNRHEPAGVEAAVADLPSGDMGLFPHGVASGDPTPSAVVLWTRVDPAAAPARDLAVPLRWSVAADPDFRDVVTRGVTEASAQNGYCVKVDVRLPVPGRTWYYRFEAPGGSHSAVGRTRTTGDRGRLRLAATTCTNPAEGVLNSLDRLSELPTLDAVVHLGDYVYEFSASAEGSAHTLEHYRARYAHWRGLAPQIDAHRAHPWIVVWDDGDIWNGVTSLERNGPTGDHAERYGDPHARRAAATRAFFEWTPSRDHTGGLWGEHSPHCHRNIPLGPLADITMLDTRLEKDVALGTDYVTIDQPGIDDPDRQIMSRQQLGWALDRVGHGAGQWQLLGSQVMIGHWGAPGLPTLPDQAVEFFATRQQGNGLYAHSWNGYAADRRRLFEGLHAAGGRDLLAFSGDSHFSMALDLTPDPMNPAVYEPATGRGSLGVEFMVPSVSSAAFPETLGYPPRTLSIPIEAADVAGNPHHVYAEFDSKGYVLVDLTAERARAEYWYVDTVTEESDTIQCRAVFEVPSGTNHVRPVLAPEHILAPV